MLPKCTRRSVVYENVCKTCNEGAGEKKELATVKEGSIYIGETSRSIFERSKEHWKDFQGRSDKSHILRHQGASHPGEQPEFIMRTVKYYRTALSRQIGEAVRIAKRGGEGAILNSKSEFERCHIPRLVLEEEEDEEEMEKKEEQRVREEQERIEIQARSWGAKAYKERMEDDRKTWEQEEKVGAKTRRAEDAPKEQRKRKRRRKLPLLGEQWGEKEEPGAGAIIPDSIIGSSPTTVNPISAPDTELDSPQLEIQRPVATKQTRVTDFMSDSHQLTPSGDTVATADEGGGTGIKEKEADVIFEHSEGVKESQGEGDVEDRVIVEEPMVSVVGDVLKEMRGDDHDDEVKTGTSVGENQKLSACESTVEGRCVRHGSVMKEILVTNKKWVDRGKGRGFGWKQTKSKKIICLDRNLPPMNSDRILDNPGDERSTTTTTSQNNGLHRRTIDGVSNTVNILDADEREISSAKGRIVEPRLDIDFYQLDLSSR